jgi:hypothetical protein
VSAGGPSPREQFEIVCHVSLGEMSSDLRNSGDAAGFGKSKTRVIGVLQGKHAE